MLTVRPEQFLALEAALVLPMYESRMLAFLRGHHAQAVAGSTDGALLALIRVLTATARSYGAKNAVAWAQYIQLCMFLGADFDRAPWAQRILASGAGAPLPWAEKMRALVAAAATAGE